MIITQSSRSDSILWKQFLEMEKLMRRKTTLGALLSIVILLAACAPGTSTESIPTSGTSPTAVSNTGAGTPATDSSSNTDTEMDASLACAGGKTSANTTVELTEGPYYTPNTPERSSLYETGMAGTKLVLTGYVYDTNCQPVANAWLDFWQADANGVYDNNGYTLRGHQYTDSNGRFELTTVVPGIYPGRTEHIHFKVQAPNGPIITSQLFFPGVAQNSSDGIFDESLLIPIQETSDGLLGQYNFVVPAQ